MPSYVDRERQIQNRTKLSKLVEKRKKNGISAAQLSAAMMASYQHVTMVERGSSNCTAEFLSRYTEALQSVLAAESGGTDE